MGAYVYAPHGATYGNVYPGQKVGQATPKKKPFDGPLNPATEKQVKFITTLMDDRQVPGATAHDLKVAITAGTLTKGAASEKIDMLLSYPKRDKSGDHKVVSQPKMTPVPGFYVNEETETFYEVVASKAGKHYAKRFHVQGKTGKWRYAPGEIKDYASWKKVSLTDAAQFGIAHGVCLCCGRTLTNPESVAAGIGPICAAKF
jgi:hypothetical protein